MQAIFANYLLHWFPTRVTRASLAWGYSLWLGTVSLALMAILTASGAILLFLYVPSVERAHASIRDLESVVSFGSWLRSVHRLGAHLMVVTVILHLARVFLTGAYKDGWGKDQRRRWNWLIGIGLLILTLAMSFTGYLLPWDQLAYWAVTTGAGIVFSIPGLGHWLRELILGGRTIDQPALIRFYVLHCFVLPGAMGVLFSYHLWRIRKDGGLASADRVKRSAGEGKSALAAPEVVRAVPDLVRRALVAVMGTWAVLGCLAVFIRSPLQDPANPLHTPNPAKAPWYFLWLQEIVTATTIRIGDLSLNGAFLGGVLLPGLLLGFLAAWPWLDRSPVGATGIWWPSERSRQIALFLAILAAVAVLTLVGAFCRGPYWRWEWPWEAQHVAPTWL